MKEAWFSRLPLLLLLAGMALLVGGSIWGLHYGHHWDEIRLLEGAFEAAQQGSILPGWYNYPSLPHALVMLAQSSYWIDSLLGASISHQMIQETLYIRTRILFILLSYCLMLGSYFLGKRVSGNAWTGLLGALLVGTSFELSYHARWIAPDVLMASFAIFSVWQAYAYLEAGQRKHLIRAAILVGLAMGCKYPGGLIGLPLLCAILLRHWPEEPRSFARKLLAPAIWKRLGVAAGLGLLVFLLTTPGILFDTQQFFQDLQYEVSHYQEGHGRHTVRSFGEHAAKMLLYFAFHGLSPYQGFALILTAFALLGLGRLLREKPRKSLLLWIFPLIYCLYFMSQKAMIVRNYLVILPFLALFASLGMEGLFSYLKRKLGTWAFALWLLLGLGILANGLHHFQAAHSITQLKTPGVFFAKLEAHLQAHEETFFVFSQGMQKQWKENLGKPLPPNVAVRPYPHTDYQVVFFSREFEKYWRYYQVNRHNYVVRIIGSQDINFNYYPEWQNEKIVIMKAKFARKLPLKF